jgi:GNAT superfamily N-acetyltransferase
VALTEAALHLRPAHEADRASMARVHLTARAAAQMPTGGVTLVDLMADFALGWNADEFWVACGGAEEEQILGYVRFVHPDDHRVGWLDDLYVLPEASGSGIGTALLDLVKGHLPGGFGLWAFERNTSARGFYRARGLREVTRVAAHDSPTGESEVEFRWP